MTDLRYALRYATLSPKQWPHTIAELVRRDEAAPRPLSIAWGDHETLPGVVDFVRSPRLRLEHFLELASEAGLKLDVTVGVPARRDALPPSSYRGSDWTLVPSATFDEDVLGFEAFPAPLHHPQSIEALADFVKSAKAIVDLYREPSGSVASLSLDLSMFEADAGLGAAPALEVALSKRYGDIARLNAAYRTTFRDFESAASERGFRTLMERRGWLACFDYFAANRALASLVSVAAELPLVADAGATSAVYLDPVPVWRCRRGASWIPFSPFGVASADTVGTARLYESFRELVGRVGWLPIDEGTTPDAPGRFAVVGGTFLARRSAEWVRTRAHEGAEILLAAGTLPKFDENLDASPLAFSHPADRVRLGGREYLRYAVGTGGVWLDVPERDSRRAADPLARVERWIGAFSGGGHGNG
jgi:hypothetical protein